MDTKHIEYTESKQKKIKLEKEKKKRIISTTDKWSFTKKELEVDNQYEYVSDISNISDIVKSEIQKKINGYKGQDTQKKLFCSEKFIDYLFVIELLNRSLLKCFYCNKNVYLIYEFVREPRQWTIERIDNSMGHNKDNVEIACLNCNLRRRTMYFERYLMTKQLKMTKVL
jgi:hypothetical protein